MSLKKKKTEITKNKNKRKKPNLQNSKYVMPWSTSHINLDRGHMGSTPDNTVSRENVVEPVSSV